MATRAHGKPSSFLIVALGAAAWILAAGSMPAHADPCAAKKNTCVKRKVAAMLACHARAEVVGASVSTACLGNAQAKFTTGSLRPAGCIELAESASGCVSALGDAAALGTAIDDFIDGVTTQLENSAAIAPKSKCAAAKQACVSRTVVALLACHAKAEKTGAPVDPICLDKAHLRFDGGSTPAKSCFAHAESKGGCLTTGDELTIESDIDGFVNSIACGLAPGSAVCLAPSPGSSTPTPRPSRTPAGTPTIGKPTKTPKPIATPGGPAQCGNGRLEDGEDCDGSDLDSYTCGDFCFNEGGTLSCNADCTFNLSACTGGFCEGP